MYDLRNNSDFLENDSQSNTHIKAKSPLLKLGVGLVTQFVLDPMHLIYQGIVKRLLVLYWIDGKRPYKMSKLSVSRISNFLLLVKKYTPADFRGREREDSYIRGS